MSTKYTPGPWTADLEGYLDGSIDVKFASQLIGERFIKVYSCNKSYDEQDANARLIAAAPELLEVLEQFSLNFASLVHDKASISPIVRDYLQRTFEDAKRLIAKAKGE